MQKVVVQSFERFLYEVTPVKGDPGYFWVSPAPGHPLQWGESSNDVWKQSSDDVTQSLDIDCASLAQLEAA